jgi:hypothetical protein
MRNQIADLAPIGAYGLLVIGDDGASSSAGAGAGAGAGANFIGISPLTFAVATVILLMAGNTQLT